MNIHNKKRKNENERSKTGIRNRKRKQVKSAQKQETILYITVH